MEVRLRVLASGSSGNALFVAFGDTAILVDAGLSGRALARELGEIGEDPAKLSAVIVTHEHDDHVRGLPDLARRYPHVPIHASAGTARVVAERWGDLVAVRLRRGKMVGIGDATLEAFAVSHDAAEPIGLRLECGDFAIAVATDLGAVTPGVSAKLSGCRALVLEANHDVEMLRNGPYPEFLKRRIASSHGHLSNRQAAEVLREAAGPGLERVVLAHLSRRNNTPERAVGEVLDSRVLPSAVLVAAAAPDRAGDMYRFAVHAAPPSADAGGHQLRLLD